MTITATTELTRRQIRYNIGLEIKDARENLAYWTRQKAIRIRPDAKAQADGLIIAWNHQLNVRQEKLNTFNAIV